MSEDKLVEKGFTEGDWVLVDSFLDHGADPLVYHPKINNYIYTARKIIEDNKDRVARKKAERIDNFLSDW